MTHITAVLWAGLAIGVVFGFAAQRIEFCLTGGLREWMNEGRPRRAAGFALATAVAVAGAQVLEGAGVVMLSESIYRQPGFSWLLIPFGGVLFGYGMMQARGCGARALVLVVDGNLRSILVLLCLGVSAYAALTGVLAPLRVTLAEATTVVLPLGSPALPDLLHGSGMSPWIARALPASLVALALAIGSLFWLGLRRFPRDIAGAVVIGSLVPASWLVTGYLGADDFEPVRLESLTFVAPIGDTIQYVMLSTGTPLGFGVTVVFGVLVGSAIASVSSGAFELRGFDRPGQIIRAAGGGALMGIGGAFALGCTIGQGLSGLSTLALPSFLAVAGILAGAVLALRGPLPRSEPPPDSGVQP